MDNVMYRAQDSGKIRTLLGRLCRFHLWEPNQFGIHKALPHEAALREHGPGIKRAYTYKALNRLIQGSAADMTKKAMIDLYKAGIIPHIQVHDELDISVEDLDHANKIKTVMEHAVSLEVPNKVDYEFGPNWGTLKEKQEKTIEKVKQLWAQAQAHPKISIAVVVVVIAIYFLVNQKLYERWLT